jgi:YD repeat-containing protein
VVTTTAEHRQIAATMDAVGRPLTVQAGTLAAQHFAYDARGRVVSWQWGDGANARSFNYAYDAERNLTHLARPGGLTTDCARDAAGRLASIVLPSDTITFKLDADEDGVGGDDAADCLRYLVATKGRSISVRKLRGCERFLGHLNPAAATASGSIRLSVDATR